MVDEAERYKAEDDLLREKVEAKNKFESYLYQLKSSLTGELKNKLSGDDVSMMQSKIKEVEQWFETHMNEEKDIYESKQKELETIFMGIMKDVNSTGMPNPENMDSSESMPSKQDNKENEPKIEEID
jgi:L1 cell adhesion molecule like protein